MGCGMVWGCVLQRDVELEVETCDKTGAFLGALYVGRVNVGSALLEAGLAKLHPLFKPDRVSYGPQLAAAQTRAKDARVALWANYDPVAEAAEAAAVRALYAHDHVDGRVGEP